MGRGGFGRGGFGRGGRTGSSNNSLFEKSKTDSRAASTSQTGKNKAEKKEKPNSKEITPVQRAIHEQTVVKQSQPRITSSPPISSKFEQKPPKKTKPEPK